MNKKIIMLLGGIFFWAAGICSAQIQTASEFFKTLSDYYATFNDYEADLTMEVAGQEMKGKVSFKKPEMVRIDFSDPAEQVFVYNGDNLVIYLPGNSAILEQHTEGNLAKSMTGLGLLKRYYTVAYESGPEAVPFEEGSEDMVINLVMYRRSTSEVFSSIRMSVGAEDNLIRRVEAKTTAGAVYSISFDNYNINTKMSDQRFIYDPPSSANNYKNFLLSE
ncbi:outer membrane lipoprotein-sorting protein [Treponema rectale]|uniref:Outer membrane lipoprotein-sorting protein n=1 Tax=Treponema rectale TaxID=744512 RepID=A0A840SCV2_9SPIR|nr:outer membrane lipoprotein carrier protein LolA [Treponema rectale]MBB5219607.1 outer membrane lipoprotein-sorting protein [Treponema rectale]